MIIPRGLVLAATLCLTLTSVAHAIPALPLPPDPNDIRNIEDRASKGSVEDQVKAGLYYDHFHDGQFADPYKAMKWFGMAAKNGNADARAKMDALTPLYAQFRHDRAAALIGDPQAAYVYAQGLEGSYADFDRTTSALNWYRRAADGGIAAAQVRMGDAQFHAYLWHMGDEPAPQFEGDTMDTDLGSTIAWFDKAAQQGDTGAMAMLGQLYAVRGPTNDADKARHWLSLAAPSDADSESLLCRWDYSGRVLDYVTNWIDDSDLMDVTGQPDYAAAHACFTHYATRSDEAKLEASYYLGEMAMHGQGMARDDAKAVELFTYVTTQPDPSRERGAMARLELGRLYSQGTGVRHDRVAAYGFYSKALDQFGDDQQRCMNIPLDAVDQARMNRIAGAYEAAETERDALATAMSAAERKAAGISDTPAPPVYPVDLFCD